MVKMTLMNLRCDFCQCFFRRIGAYLGRIADPVTAQRMCMRVKLLGKISNPFIFSLLSYLICNWRKSALDPNGNSPKRPFSGIVFGFFVSLKPGITTPEIRTYTRYFLNNLK